MTDQPWPPDALTIRPYIQRDRCARCPAYGCHLCLTEEARIRKLMAATEPPTGVRGRWIYRD